MNVNFDDNEIIFLCGYFSRKIKELDELASSPQNPIHPDSIKADIKLYSSIVEKLAKSNPNLTKLNLL